MADDFNNLTGKPGADGISDDLASPLVQKAMQANTAKSGDGTPSIKLTDLAGDPTSGLQVDPTTGQLLLNGVPVATGQKDDTFPVRISPGSYQAGQGIVEGAKVPFHTLTKDGFLGVTDQGIIDRVVAASGGKTKIFDKVYLAAVDKAALEQKAGKDVTVYDVLDQWRKGGLPSGMSSNGGGGSYSTVNRVVSLTDEGTARRLLNTALTGYLGRSATDDENRAFLKALNVQERENPSITKTTGYSSGRNTTQEQMVTGGMDKNDFADRFAKSQQGYAEYQAATTYLDAFIGALKDTSRVVG